MYEQPKLLCFRWFWNGFPLNFDPLARTRLPAGRNGSASWGFTCDACYRAELGVGWLWGIGSCVLPSQAHRYLRMAVTLPGNENYHVSPDACLLCFDWLGVSVLCGNVCPARTGPLEGPNFPLEDRDLPYLASCLVKIAIVRQKCAKLCKSQGSQPKLGPFSGRMRAGQTFPP